MKKIPNKIIEILDDKFQAVENVIIAIEGRCGSGKTTLAIQLQEKYKANVIHMDDFFLTPEQRTIERLKTPGENVDYERFYKEVMMPLKQGKGFSYRPFDCRKQKMGEPIVVNPCPVTIIEGSYCCHNKLWAHYDLRLFLTVEPQEQLRRIREREGLEKAEIFSEKWIPMEEKYFTAFQIEKRCDYCITM